MTPSVRSRLWASGIAFVLGFAVANYGIIRVSRPDQWIWLGLAVVLMLTGPPASCSPTPSGRCRSGRSRRRTVRDVHAGAPAVDVHGRDDARGHDAANGVAGGDLVGDVRRRAALRDPPGAASPRCWSPASPRSSRCHWRSPRRTRWCDCRSGVGAWRTDWSSRRCCFRSSRSRDRSPTRSSRSTATEPGCRSFRPRWRSRCRWPSGCASRCSCVPWTLREAVRADGATRRQGFGRFACPARCRGSSSRRCWCSWPAARTSCSAPRSRPTTTRGRCRRR